MGNYSNLQKRSNSLRFCQFSRKLFKVLSFGIKIRNIKPVLLFYFIIYLSYSVQLSESFTIRSGKVLRVPKVFRENAVSNLTTEATTATLSTPGSPLLQSSTPTTASSQIIKNENNASNSAPKQSTRQQRQIRDRARFLLGSLRRQNCFSKVLCNVGASPLSSKNDEDILDQYVTLMDELLTDEEKQNIENAGTLHRPKPTSKPIQSRFTRTKKPTISRDPDDSPEDLEEDDKPIPQLEVDEDDSFLPNLDQLPDEELDIDDPLIFREFQKDLQKRGKRPPVYFGGGPQPQYYPPSGLPYARYRRSAYYSDEQASLNNFLLKRRLELDNTKDFRKRLSLAADTGRTLGFANQRQCWRLFHDCPLNNQQLDSLVKGLRQIINAKGNISSLATPATASPGNNVGGQQGQNGAKPGNKVEIILNLGANGMPYGQQTITNGAGFPMISSQQYPAPEYGLMGNPAPQFSAPVLPQVNPYAYPPYQVPSPVITTTTAKPEVDEKLMDFLYGVLNYNETQQPMKDEDDLSDWLLPGNKKVSEKDYVETPLKVRNRPKKSKPKKQKLKFPDPFGLGLDTLFEDDEDADPPGDDELMALKDYLGSYKKVLSKLYQMNNVTKVASKVLEEEKRKQKEKEDEIFNDVGNNETSSTTTTTTEKSIKDDSEEEDEEEDVASEESGESGEEQADAPAEIKKNAGVLIATTEGYQRDKSSEEDEEDDEEEASDESGEVQDEVPEVSKKVPERKPTRVIFKVAPAPENATTTTEASGFNKNATAAPPTKATTKKPTMTKQELEMKLREALKSLEEEKGMLKSSTEASKARDSLEDDEVEIKENKKVPNLTQALLSKTPKPALKIRKPIVDLDKKIPLPVPLPVAKEFENVAGFVENSKIVDISEFGENSTSIPEFSKKRRNRPPMYKNPGAKLRPGNDPRATVKPKIIQSGLKNETTDVEDSEEIYSAEPPSSEEYIPYDEQLAEKNKNLKSDQGASTRVLLPVSKEVSGESHENPQPLIAIPYFRENLNGEWTGRPKGDQANSGPGPGPSLLGSIFDIMHSNNYVKERQDLPLPPRRFRATLNLHTRSDEEDDEGVIEQDFEQRDIDQPQDDKGKKGKGKKKDDDKKDKKKEDKKEKKKEKKKKKRKRKKKKPGGGWMTPWRSPGSGIEPILNEFQDFVAGVTGTVLYLPPEDAQREPILLADDPANFDPRPYNQPPPAPVQPVPPVPQYFPIPIYDGDDDSSSEEDCGGGKKGKKKKKGRRESRKKKKKKKKKGGKDSCEGWGSDEGGKKKGKDKKGDDLTQEDLQALATLIKNRRATTTTKKPSNAGRSQLSGLITGTTEKPVRLRPTRRRLQYRSPKGTVKASPATIFNLRGATGKSSSKESQDDQDSSEEYITSSQRQGRRPPLDVDRRRPYKHSLKLNSTVLLPGGITYNQNSKDTALATQTGRKNAQNENRGLLFTQKKPQVPQVQTHQSPTTNGWSALKNFNFRNLLSRYGNSLLDRTMAAYNNGR